MVHFRSRGIGLEQCIQLMKNSRNGTIWFHGEREKNTKLFFNHYLDIMIGDVEEVNVLFYGHQEVISYFFCIFAI